MILQKKTDQGNNEFRKIRPLVTLNQGPLFKFTDRDLHESDYHHSVLMSIPMTAHFLGLNSIKDIVYHRMQIRLKEGGPKSIEDNLFLDIKNAMPYGSYGLS